MKIWTTHTHFNRSFRSYAEVHVTTVAIYKVNDLELRDIMDKSVDWRHMVDVRKLCSKTHHFKTIRCLCLNSSYRVFGGNYKIQISKLIIETDLTNKAKLANIWFLSCF